MTRYLMNRLVQGIIALLFSSILVFFLLRLTGDPTTMLLTPDATLADVEALRRNLGLDQPYPVQYFLFMKDILSGDFGNSLFYRRPVLDLILSRFPATLYLALIANALSIIVAVPFGVIAAVNREKWQDGLAKAIAILGQSLPGFWLAIVLIQIFSVWLGWLPSSGYGKVEYFILPCFALGFHSVAAILRLTRSAMLDVLGADYIRLARIKGLSERLVIWKHGLRNALIPVVTFAGMHFVRTLAGSVVIETIFAWPGVGRLAYEAVVKRDFPVEQGILILFTAMFILFNLMIDVMYLFLDPRVKLHR
jgi:peptide/nickel transport system permease protein